MKIQKKILFLSLLLSATAPAMLGMDKSKTPQPRLTSRIPVVDMAKQTISYVLVPSAFVDAADQNGDTHLHDAVLNGQTEVVKQLLDAKANVNAADQNGDTPLHKAVLNGRTKTAQSLLQAHANVDAADQFGHTPLHYAVWTDHTETANLLIEWSAQPTDDRTRQLLEQHTKHLQKDPPAHIVTYRDGLTGTVEEHVPKVLAQLIAGYVLHEKTNLDLIIDFNRTLLRTSSYVGQAPSAEAAVTERNARFAARATPRIKHDADDEKHSTKK